MMASTLSRKNMSSNSLSKFSFEAEMLQMTFRASLE